MKVSQKRAIWYSIDARIRKKQCEFIDKYNLWDIYDKHYARNHRDSRSLTLTVRNYMEEHRYDKDQQVWNDYRKIW